MGFANNGKCTAYIDHAVLKFDRTPGRIIFWRIVTRLVYKYEKSAERRDLKIGK